MSTAQDVLQTMITPAVLISATGTLIMSTSNRTARVNDRVRELAATLSDRLAPAEVGGFPGRQLDLLAQRLVLLRSAMLSLYLAMGAFVAASLAIGISSLVDLMEGWGAVGIGLAGAAVLFAACFQLVRESRLAARTTLEELEHLRRSLER